MHIIAILALLSMGCKQEQEGATLFEKMPPTATDVGFANRLTESDSMNIIEYLYFYNGGGVAAGDVDGNGLPDLYFTANQGPNKLYLNRGNFRFEEVTERAGVSGQGDWKTGVSMADVNGDGWLDIYVCQVGNYKNLQGRNELFINNGDGTFREMAREFGLDFRGFSQQAAFFDYDLDGDLDCYLLNHSVHSPENYGPSELRERTDSLSGDRLLRNDDGRFVDVTAEAGIYSSRLGFGLAVRVGDIDDNGCPDLYISNDFHENDYLYYNQCDGTFREDLAASVDYTSTFSMGSDLADLDNDGRLDLMTLDMKPEAEPILKASVGADPYDIYEFKLRFGYHYQYPRNMLQWNRGKPAGGEPQFSEIGQYAGLAATDWSWSVLLDDLDNDGWSDVYVTNGIWRRPNDLDYLKYISNAGIQSSASDLELLQQMPIGEIANYAYRNRGDQTFEDVSAEWGLDLTGCSQGAALADLDGDGDLDLAVNNLNAEAAIYRNRSELDPARHSLRLELRQPGANPLAFGSRLTVYAAGRSWVRELAPVRGWQSCSEPVVHVGLGATAVADSLRVRWPDGQSTVFPGPFAADSLHRLRREGGQLRSEPAGSSAMPAFFQEVSGALGIDFRHRENDFTDFVIEKLLPHKLSTEGPCLAVADANGDGLDDFFVGGAAGQSGALYLQEADGRFRAVPGLEETLLPEREDVAAAWFDADGDGDADLYVVSGGGQFPDGDPRLGDRLYLNDGQAGLSLSADLPPVRTNGACVVPFDYDADGRLDLFVGSRSIPGRYGLAPRSFLLHNEGQGRFSETTGTILPGLGEVGMVTDACWLPGSRQLLVVGEWMPVVVADFSATPATLDRRGPSGWWNTVEAVDLDQNGRPDLLLGNLGRNTNLGSPGATVQLTLHVADFDGNGSTDPILGYFRDGKHYPFAGKDELAQQLVPVKKRFVQYEAFAASDLETIFGKQALEQANRLQAELLASAVWKDFPEGSPEPLPGEAQYSPLMALTAADVDADGRPDVLGGGNFYGCPPAIGRLAASRGLTLLNEDDGFREMPPAASGLFLEGEVRDLAWIRLAGGGRLLLVAFNDGPLRAFRLSIPKD